MNDIMPATPMPAETTTDENQQPLIADGEVCLEQQMAELGMSNDTRRFLRDLQRPRSSSTMLSTRPIKAVNWDSG